MTSLYNRATPRQAVLLRMIEGAARNAAHAHPGRVLDDRLARSIAKRAAGTLSAQWPAVLAAPRARSEGGGKQATTTVTTGRGSAGTRSGGAVTPRHHGSGREASVLVWRLPLILLHKELSGACGAAKRAGDYARRDTLVGVLRIIGAMLILDAPPVAVSCFITRENRQPRTRGRRRSS